MGDANPYIFLVRRLDDRIALIETLRHWLLDENVAARSNRLQGQSIMRFGWCTNIDDVGLLFCKHFTDISVGRCYSKRCCSIARGVHVHITDRAEIDLLSM